MALSDLVNFARYPLGSIDEGQLKQWRDEFRDTGICVLEEFLVPEQLSNFVREAEAQMPAAYHNTLTGNAYLEELDPSLPADHAKSLVDQTALGVVAYDQIPADSRIRRVYESSEVTEFIRQIADYDELHHYACPLGALNLSVMQAGDNLRWHFDLSDFVVSIPLQDAATGGVFEYVPAIRSAREENFSGVKRVLEGDRSLVQELSTPPGSLILFQGRYTLHRVTEIAEQTPRLVALLGYGSKPGVTSSPHLRQIRYGRTE